MEELPIPLSRVELYLAKAAGMNVTIPETPLSRLEQFLAVIAGDTNVEMPIPYSFSEQWLSCVYYGASFVHPPIEGAYRTDNQKVDARYFAVASGVPGATLPPAPQNRKERYWAVIAQNGPIHGLYKYVTGTSFDLIDVMSDIQELKFVYGDAYQTTYAGKNLLNMPITDGSESGLTWVKNADGSMTINGTASAGIHIYGNYTMPQAWLGQTLTLSTDNANVGVNMGFKNSAGGGNQLILDYGVTSKTQKITQGNIDITARFEFYVKPGTVLNDFTVHVMLEYGSTVSPYEPYTGGIPSPNPDYPQNVECVAGVQTMSIVGKNLLSLSGLGSPNDRARASIEGSSITVTAVQAGVGFYSVLLPDSDNLLGKTITVSVGSAVSDGTNKGRVIIYQATKKNPRSVGNWNVTIDNIDSSGVIKTVTLPSSYSDNKNCFTIVFYVNTNAGSTAVGEYTTYSNVQVEFGSNATEYSSPPQNLSLSLDGNLFNKNAYNAIPNGYDDSGKIVLGSSGVNYTFWIPCKPSTAYSFKLPASSTNPPIDYKKIYTTEAKPDIGVSIYGVTSTIAKDTETYENYVTPNNANYLCIRIRGNDLISTGTGIDLTLESLQIIENTTLTPTTSIELCKIGDYQDYIYEGDDGWYLHKATRHLSLAIANMNNAEDYPGWKGLTQFKTDMGAHNATLALYVPYQTNISGFITKNAVESTGPISFNTTGSNSTLYLRRAWYGESFNQTYWKTTYPDSVMELFYGIYVAPSDTKITDTTLIAQLDAIASATLPRPEAHIRITAADSNLPAPLEIGYLGRGD